MNNDMPWVNLTQEEVDELRKQKNELTEYGKQRLKELMEKQSITAKVSEEDYQKVLDLMKNQEPYPDAMFEEAERREKLNAGFKQDAEGNWYRPTLEELTRNERIDLAVNEMRYILWGGQDGEEFGNSVAFVVNVLDSLKDD